MPPNRRTDAELTPNTAKLTPKRGFGVFWRTPQCPAPNVAEPELPSLASTRSRSFVFFYVT